MKKIKYNLNRSFYEFFRLSLRKILIIIYKFLTESIQFLKTFNQLKKINFEINFIHEGKVKIQLPTLNFIQALFFKKSIFKKEMEFLYRPVSETLLRKIVFHLFNTGYFDKKKSIIDIGCWIGDNSLIWAKNLKQGGYVFAIDPSKENINFGKILCNINNINNVKWINEVCSNKIGVPLDFFGPLDHATFNLSKSKKVSFHSNTLDNIVEKKYHSLISLLHVDVEGFEENVIKGAFNILKKSKPTIIFEQHISKDKVNSLISYLKEKNYSIFLINEIIPNCDLDCRNFIAFDNSKKLPTKFKIEHKNGRKNNTYYATLDEALIKVS